MKKVISLVLVILTLFSVMSLSVSAADKVALCENGEHEWVQYERQSPTCTREGILRYNCKNCYFGIKSEKYADMLSHKDENHNGKCDVCDCDTTLGCKCYCHTVKDGRTGILTPFAIFMQFFAKIFKINHYCDCGYHIIYK